MGELKEVGATNDAIMVAFNELKEDIQTTMTEVEF